MAKKKFDTNPLDPDFPKKTAFEPQPQETQTLSNNGAADTNQFETSPVMEEPATRKFDEANFNQYQSPYSGQNVPSPYQPPQPLYAQNDRSRKVAKVGLPENVLTALPYVPFYIGLIVGLLALFFVPKSEAKVRFHAAQGVAAHLAILVISAILGGLSNITNLAHAGETIFNIVTTVMLVIFAIKAFQGKPIHIEAVDDLTNWLEDKIKPSE
ncbi:MAG TPA: hypothetical protein VGC97_17400 [Pyrinomonadaceae bacterium]|jgi:uncharacterized membrane protein